MGANLSQSWPFSLCAWIRRSVWYLKWHYLSITARSKCPLTDKATWIYSSIIHFAEKRWFENCIIMEDKASAAPLLALCGEFCCFFVPNGGHSLWNWCLGNGEHEAAGASTGVHRCEVVLAANFSVSLYIYCMTKEAAGNRWKKIFIWFSLKAIFQVSFCQFFILVCWVSFGKITF